MSFRNSYLFNSYKDILLNNQIILFCERSSISPGYLRKLKVELGQDDFYLTSIKNDVFKKQIKRSRLVNLIRGPIFIFYKRSIDLQGSFKTFRKFIDYKFILSCLFQGKLYSPQIFKNFMKINSISRFFNEIRIIIHMLLSGKLGFVSKQLVT